MLFAWSVLPEKNLPGEDWHNTFARTEIMSKSLTPQIDKGKAGALRDALIFFGVSQQVNRRNMAPSQVPCLADKQPTLQAGWLSQGLWSHSLLLSWHCFHLKMEERSDDMKYICYACQWSSRNRKQNNCLAKGNKIQNHHTMYFTFGNLHFKIKTILSVPFESMRLKAWQSTEFPYLLNREP